MISITIAFLASAPGAYRKIPNGRFLKVTSAVAPVASASVKAFAPFESASAYPGSWARGDMRSWYPWPRYILVQALRPCPESDTKVALCAHQVTIAPTATNFSIFEAPMVFALLSEGVEGK